MGVMLVVGFAALIVAIATRPPHRPRDISTDHRRATASIEIPRGARIEAMTTSPDRLILDLVLPDGDRQILSIDLATGARVGVIELHPAPPVPQAAASPPAGASPIQQQQQR